jgi:outer membrane protein assembly factor BamA
MVTAGALSLAPVRLRFGPTRVRLLAALLTFATVALPAGPEAYEGRQIVAVRFDPADQPVMASELPKYALPIRAGIRFQTTDLHSAMERLFTTGRYRDIAIDIKEEGDGIVVTFVTVAERFVRDVQVEGVSEPPSTGQLANATKFDLGQPFRRPQIQQATETIMDNLRLNGLYEAKVTSRKIGRAHV